jgi:hypothetical membrane protein
MLPSNRTTGLLALAMPFWFALVYLCMSSMRPEYSHYTKAISELGSIDAPNRWIWNIGGYVVPGLVVALLGFCIADQLRGSRGIKLASYSLVVSGLLMAMSGVFPGDFDNRTSLTMILHAIGSFGSFVAFLICGFTLPWILRRDPRWRPYAWPSLALVILSIASGFLRTGAAPGIGQRLGFACFFVDRTSRIRTLTKCQATGRKYCELIPSTCRPKTTPSVNRASVTASVLGCGSASRDLLYVCRPT